MRMRRLAAPAILFGLTLTAVGLSLPTVARAAGGGKGSGGAAGASATTPSSSDAASSSTPAETTNSKAILLWGPSGVVEEDARARAALLERLPKDALFPARVLRVSEWLGAAKFRLGGSAIAVPCATPPPEIEIPEGVKGETAATVALGRKALDDLDYNKSLEWFQLAQGRIPCQTEFVQPQSLWEAYFYAGISAFYAGQTKAAESSFRSAAAVDPKREWDPRFPPDPQSTFLSAVKDVLTRPEARVYGDMRGTNYVEVRLDGEMLDLTKPFETTVHPGVHLVQAVDEQGRWATFVRQLDEGGTLTFFSAMGAEQMLLDGPDGTLKNIAASVLNKKAREERLTEIYLVTLDGSEQVPPRVFSYAPDYEQWTRLERTATGEVKSTTEAARPTDVEGGAEEQLSPQERNQRAILRDPDYRSSATFGFKFFTMFVCGPRQVDAQGFCIADGTKRENTYIGGLIGIDVRLVKGLNLDFRFGSTVTDLKDGGTLLPEFAIGMRYRFLQGVIQPYLAIAADILIGTTRANAFAKDQVQVYGGLLGYGGLDFEFPDGFRLTLEGGGGVVIGGESRTLNWPIAHMLFAIGRFLP
jgi:hypothetical protein